MAKVDLSSVGAGLVLTDRDLVRFAAVSGAGTTNIDGDAAFEFELLIEEGGVLASAYRAGDFIL